MSSKVQLVATMRKETIKWSLSHLLLYGACSIQIDTLLIFMDILHKYLVVVITPNPLKCSLGIGWTLVLPRTLVLKPPGRGHCGTCIKTPGRGHCVGRQE